MNAPVEVWLRCPACDYTWRAAVITSEPQWQSVTPESLAMPGCNKCDTDRRMELVRLEQPLRAEVSA